MADVNSQVALGINAPDPNQGLNTLSKIMTLGSQGLGIRGQQSQNQSLAAKATVDTQSAKENQALAQLMSDPIKNGIVDQDGNPTKDAQTIIMRAAPTTGSQHTSALLDAATKKVGFNSAVNSLRTDERQEVASTVSGASAGAKGPEDITNALDALVASKKGTPEEGNYQTIANTAKEAITHVAGRTSGSNPPPSGQEPWRQAGMNIGRSILPIAATAGAAGIGTPQQGTNAAGQNQLVNPVTGERTMPQLAGGATNPTSTTVAGNTAGTIGGVGADRERANQVSNGVAGANRAITITKEVDDLADQVHSGKFAEYVSKAAAAAGKSSDTYARQLLEKDLGTLKSEATAGAPSDQRQATVLSGFPDATSDNQTIHTAMDYRRGMARQDLARGNLLNQVKSKDPNIRGFQHADDVLTGSTDPLMHEFASLKPGAERQGFYKRNFGTDAKKMEEFRDKVAGMGHLSVIGQQ